MALGFDFRDVLLPVHGQDRIRLTGQRFQVSHESVHFSTAIINATTSTPYCHHLKLDAKPRAAKTLRAHCGHGQEIFINGHKTASLDEAEVDNSEVDLNMERREMLDVCTLRHCLFF